MIDCAKQLLNGHISTTDTSLDIQKNKLFDWQVIIFDNGKRRFIEHFWTRYFALRRYKQLGGV